MASLENQITSEYETLVQMDRIQRELMTLEKSLNNCIDLASSSVQNNKLNQYYDQLRTDNRNSFRKSNWELSETINSSKRMLIGLVHEKEKKDKAEQEEKIKEEKKEEN